MRLKMRGREINDRAQSSFGAKPGPPFGKHPLHPAYHPQHTSSFPPPQPAGHQAQAWRARDTSVAEGDMGLYDLILYGGLWPYMLLLTIARYVPDW